MHKQLFPRWMINVFIIAIPLSEILICVALFSDKFRQAGFIGSLVLMSLFTLYTATVLLNFFERIPCGCGGVIRKLNWNQHLVLNLIFLGISLVGVLTNRNLNKQLHPIQTVIN
jgi:putative oxidoreductase